MPLNQPGRSRLLHELALALNGYTRSQEENGVISTPIPGFAILRSDHAMQPSHYFLKPALLLSIQGAKWAIVGRKRYDYAVGQALIIASEAPSRCTIPAASRTKPFLGLVIELDRASIQEMMEELGLYPKTVSERTRKSPGAFVLDLNLQLLDCALRSVRLLQTPEAISVLYSGILREMSYWILKELDDTRIGLIGRAIRLDKRIIQATKYLRKHFKEPVRIEDLATAAGMSTATFHRQFRSATSISPLQYQKQLRLMEGRRLIIAGRSEIATTAFEVGYRSVSQFSREYARMFRKSPRQEMSAMKA